MEEHPTSKNMSSPEETSEPGRKFKASELTFNLPEELQQEFEQQVERLKEQEATSNMVYKLFAEEALSPTFTISPIGGACLS